MLCYGLLYNGRVLYGAFGFLIRLSLVAYALGEWPLVPRRVAGPRRDPGPAGDGRPAQHRRLSRPGRLAADGDQVRGRASGRAFQAHTGLTQVFTALPLLLAWVGLLCRVCRHGLQSVLVAGRAAHCRGRGHVPPPLPRVATDELCGDGRALLCGQRLCPLPARGPCWLGHSGGTSTSLRLPGPVPEGRGRCRHSSGLCRRGDCLGHGRLLSGASTAGRDADQWDPRHGWRAIHRRAWGAWSRPAPPLVATLGSAAVVAGAWPRLGAHGQGSRPWPGSTVAASAV